MLACARIGAVHSVVFGGFAAKELATRIDDAEPKVILTASCGVEPGRIVEYKPLLDLAIALARHKPAACVVFQRPQARAEMTDSRAITTGRRWSPRRRPQASGRPAPISPRPIRSISSTPPARPACRRGSCGTSAAISSRSNGRCRRSMTVKPGDTFWTASDIGWVVGHSYIVYGPLIHGCASVLYEGKPIGTPDAGAYLAGDPGLQGRGVLHRADRLPRRAQGGPGGEAPQELRHLVAATSVPRRRARRPGHGRLGADGLRRAGRRSLVADRDRLADRRQSGRPRDPADQARLAERADAGL